MEEKTIIQTAIHNLYKLTGVSLKEKSSPGKIRKPDRQPDGFVEIEVGNTNYPFWVEIKNELRQHHLPGLIHRMRNEAADWLLICQYVSQPNRALLKSENINYLDASGNCHIRKGSLFLYINDQKVTPQRLQEQGKLWKPAGLRFLFSILIYPELLNSTHRQMASQSLVSLGMIGFLIQELDKEKYILRVNDRFKLHNREALLNRWIETFVAVLRPKLIQGRFRFATEKDRLKWNERKLKNIFWGGEPAGAILTKHLTPENFTLYSSLQKTDVMKQLHVVPDPNGCMELLKPFWKTDQESIQNKVLVVPPLLVYAELKTSLDSRNVETAERIKKQYNV